jgi:transposase
LAVYNCKIPLSPDNKEDSYDKIGFNAIGDDVLRNPGFSKDGKTSESQIVLGLLVSEGGYLLSYSIFNGSQYEGYTIIPIFDDFV